MYNPINSATAEFTITIPNYLPHSKVYQVQVGSKLFKISGASFSSDGPSYFTKFFQDSQNKDKILFIDRSPVVFEKIYSHLQGYSVNIDDAYLYNQLILDAIYYLLPKLANHLEKDFGVFAIIGEKSFNIPNALLNSPGNVPNYFTINSFDFNGSFRTSAENNLLRPPPTRPINVPHRSSLLFSDILELLKGNDNVIKDANHRKLLIKECKYYRFLELEQRLIPCEIINNPFLHYQEIIIDINDIAKKGLSVPQLLPKQEIELQYQRPLIQREPKRDLIFKVDSSSDFEVKLFLNKTLKLVTTKFSKSAYYKIDKLFMDYIAPKDFLTDDSDPSSPTIFFITTLRESKCTINGLEMKNSWIEDILGVEHDEINEGLTDLILKRPGSVSSQGETEDKRKKRKLDREIEGDVIEFRIISGSWKLSLIDGHPKLIGVNLSGCSDVPGFWKEYKHLAS